MKNTFNRMIFKVFQFIVGFFMALAMLGLFVAFLAGGIELLRNLRELLHEII